VINRQDLDGFPKFIAEEAYDHTAPDMVGPKGARDTLAPMWASIPDVHYEIHTTVAEGDLVTLLATISGSHIGAPFYGMLPPSGKTFAVQAMQTLRLKDGKYEEHWGGISMLSLMNQLGFFEMMMAGAGSGGDGEQETSWEA
jgi:predicted ester cyclase